MSDDDSPSPAGADPDPGPGRGGRRSGGRGRGPGHGWHDERWQRHQDHWRRHGPGRPPWWPEGEPFPPWGPGPPFRPPWQGTRRFRRRLLLSALGFIGLIVGLGMLFGLLFGGGGRWDDDKDNGEQDRPRLPLIGFVVTATAATALATTVAYRRLSRPVGELLDAAELVATGDFDVTIEPEGPRELRTLTTAFNDMAGRLAATDEQRRRFLADVSHELRTPLAVLQSGIEAQIDGVHPRDDQHLASLLDETHRLGRLVEDLHTLALAEAGEIVLHREPLDPAALVADAVAGHRPLADSGGITLRAETPTGTDLPEIEADPVRLRQVLDNLLANALRHTPSGGEVVLSVTAGGANTAEPSARFTVTDTGPGFPPDQLDAVFDRFVRAADSQGSGLGLSIARDLVHAHGGTITASNRPGGGAMVTVTLP